MATDFSQQEVTEGRFFALISYMMFLCIVALLFKKENKFALYHAKQGLVLFVFEVGALILSSIPLLNILTFIFLLLCTLVSLWSILEVLQGRLHRIPGIADIADKITI